MGKSFMFNPHNIDPEELMVVNDKIRATGLDIKEMEERRVTLRDDPERLKEISEYIRRKEADLARFKEERKHIIQRCSEDLE